MKCKETTLKRRRQTTKGRRRGGQHAACRGAVKIINKRTTNPYNDRLPPASGSLRCLSRSGLGPTPFTPLWSSQLHHCNITVASRQAADRTDLTGGPLPPETPPLHWGDGTLSCLTDCTRPHPNRRMTSVHPRAGLASVSHDWLLDGIEVNGTHAQRPGL